MNLGDLGGFFLCLRRYEKLELCDRCDRAACSCDLSQRLRGVETENDDALVSARGRGLKPAKNCDKEKENKEEREEDGEYVEQSRPGDDAEKGEEGKSTGEIFVIDATRGGEIRSVRAKRRRKNSMILQMHKIIDENVPAAGVDVDKDSAQHSCSCPNDGWNFGIRSLDH